MHRFALSAITLLLFAALPGDAFAQSVCTILKAGSPSLPLPPPVAIPQPDIQKLAIQIRSTRALNQNVPGITPPTTQGCLIESDIAEVDMMTKDAGFAGYGVGDEGIFAMAYAQHVQTAAERNIIREVVRAIIDPSGDGDQALAALKSNGNLYDPRVLNVYYVHPDTADEPDKDDQDFLLYLTGIHIRNEQRKSEKMIFVGEGARPDTVVHEFAHAFSAGHVNFWDYDGVEWCTKYLPYNNTLNGLMDMKCDFKRANYMWAGSLEDRVQLGDPQKERMRRNEHSVIYEFSPHDDSFKCPDHNSNPVDKCTRLVGL